MKRDNTTRIVSVCVCGEPVKSSSENGERIKMVRVVAEEIERAGWRRVDAILFPGGFFHTDETTGDLDFDGRRRHLGNTPFSEAAIRACQTLSKLSSSCYVICGVDSDQSRPAQNNGDQFCVAWSVQGIQAVGRKVFPAPNERAKPDRETALICYAEDFDTNHRLIKLTNDKEAVLCACYDIFGCEFASAKTIIEKSNRTRYIEEIMKSGCLSGKEDPGFRSLRTEKVKSFGQLLTTNRVSVGLGAIHKFERPGLDNRWQRHGIAVCSAALDGLCVCAAHFEYKLPDADKTNQSTLAASDVPASHLTQGVKRKAHRLGAAECFSSFDGGLLVRLFEW
jgi:hypothetical protein